MKNSKKGQGKAALTPTWVRTLVDEFRKAGPIRGRAKWWILPNGKVQRLGGLHHDAWLQANPAVAKQFGLSAKELNGDHQSVRLAALQKGFVRIAYEVNAGQLVIEGMADDWTDRTKTIVVVFIAAHAPILDNITVNLFDRKEQVVEQASARVFEYGDSDKLDYIPLIEAHRVTALRKILSRRAQTQQQKAGCAERRNRRNRNSEAGPGKRP